MKRHKWEPLKDGSRWRALEQCAHCGARKWCVQFPSSRGALKQHPLFAAANTYTPWGIWSPPCTGPQVSVGGGK